MGAITIEDRKVMRLLSDLLGRDVTVTSTEVVRPHSATAEGWSPTTTSWSR